MRILAATNIILEIVLEQDRAAEARALLAANDEHDFFSSDFSLHSIGVLFIRRRQYAAFREFLNDLIADAGMTILALSVSEIESVAESAQALNLDFDDAYQYTIATTHDLVLVSFDHDFDRTPRGRRTPAEIIAPPALVEPPE